MLRHFVHPFGRVPKYAYVPFYANMDTLNFLGRYLIEVTREEKLRTRVRRDIVGLIYMEAHSILEQEGLNFNDNCFVGVEQEDGDVQWKLVVGWGGPAWQLWQYKKDLSKAKKRRRPVIDMSRLLRDSLTITWPNPDW